MYDHQAAQTPLHLNRSTLRYHPCMSDPIKSFRLDGKTILITGASSGIGAILARQFAAAGGRVALAARRVERLQALADELRATGAAVTTVALDVTRADMIATALAQIEAELGIVDVLINNAGVAQPASFLKTSAETLESTMATNFTAAWNLTAEIAKRLVAAKRGGSVINIASVLGLGVGPGYSAYSASKAALISLTRSLSLEFVRYGIRVNALAPGWFITEMNEAYFATDAGLDYLKRIPPGRAGQLGELVGPALLLASDAGSYVNGVVLPVDGGHHVALV
jgi:NAD(P)-dependent dehydrogenase (short-subunit alcohol dehydrogenase family)